jgi:hypothetical protein
MRLHPSIVIAREGGRSSTPRPIGSNADASGILDRPDKPGDDSGVSAEASPPYFGTTAVASISSRAALSTSRTTCTSAIAG